MVEYIALGKGMDILVVKKTNAHHYLCSICLVKEISSQINGSLMMNFSFKVTATSNYPDSTRII